MGYHRAGFEVEGVDIKPQPHYPFKFHLMDVLDLSSSYYLYSCFDAYHASPPCQRWSEITPTWAKSRYADLIAPIRYLLLGTGQKFVIENVECARKQLDHPIMLCGSMFGLGVWRHRYFELFGFECHAPSQCFHIGHPVTVNPGSNARKNQGKRNIAKEKVAMDIDWMTGAGLSQAIPKAYTEYIGKYLIEEIKAESDIEL